MHSSVGGVLLTARRQGRISILGTISDKKLVTLTLTLTLTLALTKA